LKRLLELQSAPGGIASGIKFSAIHEALLNNPTGVRVDAFGGASAIPEEVCVHLRRFHAFLYHFPSEEYRYAGKEYENAAKEL
jgi:hypothetical protein